MNTSEMRPVDVSEIRSAEDLIRLAAEVRASGRPCLLRDKGKDLAVIVGIDDHEQRDGIPKSRRHLAELLALAGSWSDLDADEMIAELDKARHEAPPSPPLDDV